MEKQKEKSERARREEAVLEFWNKNNIFCSDCYKRICNFNKSVSHMSYIIHIPA